MPESCLRHTLPHSRTMNQTTYLIIKSNKSWDCSRSTRVRQSLATFLGTSLILTDHKVALSRTVQTGTLSMTGKDPHQWRTSQDRRVHADCAISLCRIGSCRRRYSPGFHEIWLGVKEDCAVVMRLVTRPDATTETVTIRDFKVSVGPTEDMKAGPIWAGSSTEEHEELEHVWISPVFLHI
jgi:hypothetical protein